MSPTRATISREIDGGGRSLFLGAESRFRVIPAEAGTGLVFRRADQPVSPNIPAHVRALDAKPVHPAFARVPARSTNLSVGRHAVATVEHMLSALTGLGVTDAIVELAGPELPILDGSASDFTDLMLDVGLRPLDDQITPITLSEPIEVRSDDGSARIEAVPRAEPGATYTYTLDYGPEGVIESQSARWDGSVDAYTHEIAPARTFCTLEEAQMLRGAGLFAHLSPAEMLVIGPDGPVDNEYRFFDEPARHKLLDLIGDLALAGGPIQADIHATRSGHALNHAMARRLADLA